MTKLTVSQISDNDNASTDIVGQSKSSDTANLQSNASHSGKRQGFFFRFMTWVAKGSEKASKSGMLCSS